MTGTHFVRFVAAAMAVTGAVLSSPALVAQSGVTQNGGANAPPAKAYNAPKTPWGEPDLQGTFSNRTITPFERSPNVKGREFFTPEEVAAMEKQAASRGGDEDRNRGTRGDVERAYNDFWWDRGTKVTTLRTSMVVDPPDGRVPPLTEEARQRQADEAKRPVFRGTGASGRGVDTWLDRSTFERCITRGLPGAMSPTAYNNNYRITQAPGVVALEIEMLGGTRVIPTDGRPHISSSIRQWVGNSVGRWEGDTLVVETTNLNGKNPFRGLSTEKMRVTERFTRIDAETIRYQFTVDDPGTWSRPWSGEMPMKKTIGPIFEHACHEGNYGMYNILAGARAEEKKAAEDAAKNTSSSK